MLGRITGAHFKRGRVSLGALLKAGFAIQRKPATAPIATGDDAIAIGNAADAVAQADVVIGDGANSTGSTFAAVAIGSSAQAGPTSTAIGQSAFAPATDQVAIGTNSNASGGSSGAVAVGPNAEARADGAVAVGQTADVNSGGARSIAIGNLSVVAINVIGAVAIGDAATVSANSGIAIGDGADVASDSGIAIGISSVGTTSTEGIAIGSAAVNNGNANGIAIGNGAAVDHPGAIAIGHIARTIVPGGLSLGVIQSSTNGTHVVGLGRDTFDATPINLWVGDFTEGIPVGADNALAITGEIVARVETTGACAYYTFRALIKLVGTTTSIVESSITEHADETAGVSAALVADDTNNKLQIQVTGIAATTIRWGASARVTHVTRT